MPPASVRRASPAREPPAEFLDRYVEPVHADHGFVAERGRIGIEVTVSVVRSVAALFGRAEDPLNGRILGEPYRVFKSPEERIRDRIRELDSALSDVERERAVTRIRREEMRKKSRQAVAGFDLTFSPVKSVSALWATADVGIQEQIVAAHHEAVADVLSLIEQHAAFTRSGDGGIAQLDTRGLIAAAFDHWDSRSGDPQLHTHVVVANRVQGPDGAWRTLDGRVLYRAAVAMSEIHNVLLADHLARRLGVNWELRERGSRRNPAFEIDAIPDELIAEFSARTAQIEANLNALLDDRNHQIHPPDRREMYALRQQATLMNRPSKHLAQPLAVLMSPWRKRANQAIGRDAVDAIQRSLNSAGERPMSAADLSSETLDAYGAATVLTLQTKRATWRRWNLLAEVARQTRLLRFMTTNDRVATLEAIVERAEQHSINLTAPDLVSIPVPRASDESVFTIHNGQIYTSPVILGAERLSSTWPGTPPDPSSPRPPFTPLDLAPTKPRHSTKSQPAARTSRPSSAQLAPAKPVSCLPSPPVGNPRTATGRSSRSRHPRPPQRSCPMPSARRPRTSPSGSTNPPASALNNAATRSCKPNTPQSSLTKHTGATATNDWLLNWPPSTPITTAGPSARTNSSSSTKPP